MELRFVSKTFRYHPPKYPESDLALIKVKPIKFTERIMPIDLPFSDKFPDTKGHVYVAGINLYLERCFEPKLKFI